MAVVNASRTQGRRIIKVDLVEYELQGMRSMLSDPSVTDVYVSTEQFDGTPAALVDDIEALTFPASWLPPSDADGPAGAVCCRRPPPPCGGGDAVRRRIDRRRLDVAFDRIGHQGSPTFRRRLATAYDRMEVTR
jgi:hypothetical protein